MTTAPRVLLIACYELGHQPLGLATPLAFLERAGVAADAIDLSVQELDESLASRADFIGISVPMHTALRVGLDVGRRVRALNPTAHLCFYGLYATLNADLLRQAGADSILSGELEDELVDRVLGRSEQEVAPEPFVRRLDMPTPARGALPPLDRYAHFVHGEDHRRVGSVESTRGCLHHCRHCPIPPIYGGRFVAVARERVLADVDQLVERGARHINFIDPDFLNGPGHAMAIAREMSRRHPGLSFDFTAKASHLRTHRELLPELGALGCSFIVSAFESLSASVLEKLDKGHTRDDIIAVTDDVSRAGIALRPTFVAFTPWTTMDDHVELLQWVARAGLVESIDPIQFTLRLLIPPGSLLLQDPSLLPHLAELDEEALTFRWTHPDPRMDSLQRRSEELVRAAARQERDDHAVFLELFELALEVGERRGGRHEPIPAPLPVDAKPPRLTEYWFC